MKNFSCKSILMQFLYYFIFHLLIFIFNLIVLSVVAFFHFELGHTLSVIDDWLYLYSWNVMITSKVLASYFIYKLLIIKSDLRIPLFNLLLKSDLSYLRVTLTLMFYILGVFIFFGKPNFVLQPDFELSKLVFSFLGVFIFFGVDVFIVFILDRFYKLSFLQKIIRLCCFPIMFYIFTRITFNIDKGNSTFIIFFSFFLLISYTITNYNLKNALLILLLVIAPLNSLFGLDLMWGGDFSAFSFKGSVTNFHLNVACLVMFLYFLRFYQVNRKKLDNSSF